MILKNIIKEFKIYYDKFNVKELYMSRQYITNLPHTDKEILIPNTNNPHLAIQYINSYVDKVYCEEFSVDISFMNAIDACYVSTMCSTKHFIKYPSGKINWFVACDLVKDLSKNMLLGNSEYFAR